MLSRSNEKLLRKLGSKKYRWQLQKFVAEGRKVVSELLEEGFIPDFLLAEEGSGWDRYGALVLEEKEFQKWSSLEAADEVLGVFPFPVMDNSPSDVVLILDGVKDPGNLGTIVRTCDWFGINTIFCTNGTVDVYNPKTVQSTMGSIARVKVIYTSEHKILEKITAEDYHLLCADMKGEEIPQIKVTGKTALVMGSESHGPTGFWKERSIRITIPRKGSSKTESLNVAVAAAIIISQLRLQ